MTGCNRGLGFELVKQLSERRDVIIFASVRNPGNVPELEAIAKKTGNIRIVKINSESVEDAEQVQSMIAKEVGKLDVLIANAGIAKYNGLGKDTPLQEFKDHWNVNVLTVVILFQAMWPLLQKSSKPKFIPISSGAGSIGSIKPGVGGRNCAYGASKAALNFICVKIQAEHAKDNGSKYYADRIVMTTGAWTEGLLDLDAQLEAKGSMVVHYQVSPGETQKYRSIPIVNHLEKGLMFPPTENGLLKFTLGKTLTNIVVSPHTGKETSWPVLGMKQGSLPHHLIQEHFAFRDEALPELKKRELSYTGVCWCTDSRDQHFLVCRHPRIDSLSVACGGSSHGFKFLPNIGKYIVDMVQGELDPEIAHAWRWRPGLEIDRSESAFGDFDLDYKDVEKWTEAKFAANGVAVNA